jgi:drug/metabolite transporter (DMT)-like permease
MQFPWTKGQHHDAAAAAAQAAGSGFLAGTIYVIAACVAWSGFFVLQSNTLQSYPAELSLTALICLMGSLMSGAVALVAERRNTHAWVIGFDTRLFTAVYAGIVCSGVAYYVQGLVSRQRGPVFVTAFNPLCMIVTSVMGSIILKEQITLGSVIGAVIIVLGLYALIWGKSKDHENQVADVSASGGSKGGAAAGELPITLAAQPNGNGKHEQLGNTRGHVFDVETPATNGHY